MKIDEKEKNTYLALGYDVAKEVDGKLEVISNAPNKTVSYAQHEKILKENGELKVKLDAAEKKVKDLEKKLKDADKVSDKASDQVAQAADKK